MNIGYLMGFISSDIKSEDITTKTGETMKKISFSIACKRKSANNITDFIYVTALGKTAETISNYFQKGRGICVTYHIQTGSYTNKDGKKIFTEDKVVESFEFPPVRKNEESTPVEAPTEAAPQETYTPEPPKSPDSGFMKIPEGLEATLPFR